MGQIDALLQRLQEGLPVSDLAIVALDARPGRFAEEAVVSVGGSDGQNRAPLAALILYRGRVEIFAQRPCISLDNRRLPFFDSPLEQALLSTVADALGPGDRVFVDCEADEETLMGMRWGVPEVITRAGYHLYRLGFTWFKSWYYPEGFREGGQKLQAEKPVDETARARHVRVLYESVQHFLARAHDLPPHPVVARALERGQMIVPMLAD